MKPEYLEALNIHCAGGCGQIVKSNWAAVCTHTQLEHWHSRGEKVYLCRRCAYNAKTVDRLTGPKGSWRIGKTVFVESQIEKA